jgi:hypothetical protein
MLVPDVTIYFFLLFVADIPHLNVFEGILTCLPSQAQIVLISSRPLGRWQWNIVTGSAYSERSSRNNCI